MPRDGAGVYSLPSGYHVTSGDTVLPEQHNPPLEDIRDALTASLPRNGAAPMTGDLNLGTKNLINGGNAALAGTLTVGGATTLGGNLAMGGHDITGAGAIAATGATMTGDIAMGSHKITGLANGTADTDAATFGQTKNYSAVLSGSVSSASSLVLDFSAAIAAGYRNFWIWLVSALPASDGATLGMYLSTNAGSTYLGSGIKQHVAQRWSTSGITQGNESSVGSAYGLLASTISSTSGNEGHFLISISLGSSICEWDYDGTVVFSSGGGTGFANGGGQVASAVNALKFAYVSGNIAKLSYDVKAFK